MAGAPVDIRLMRGIDAQNDARVAAPDSLLTADNVYFDREGNPRKRAGYKTISSEVAGTTVPLSATAVHAHKSALLALDDKKLYTRSTSQAKWVPRDWLIPCNTSLRPASPTQANQTACDTARWQGRWEVTVYAVASGLRYSIQDTNDQSYLVFDQPIAVNGGTLNPRLVATPSNLLLVTQNASGHWVTPILPDALAPAQTSVLVNNLTGISAVATDGTYTVLAVASNFSGPTSYVNLYRLFPNGTASAVATLPSQGFSTTYSPTITAVDITPYYSGSAGKFTVSWAVGPIPMPLPAPAGSRNSVVVQENYDVAAASYVTPAQSIYYNVGIAAASTQPVTQVAALHQAGASVQTHVTWTPPASNNTQNTLSSWFPSQGNGTVAALDYAHSVTLASRPFAYSGQTYVFVTVNNRTVTNYATASGVGTPTYAATTPQACMFLFNVSAGRFVAQLGYGITQPSARLPSPMVNGATFEVPALKVVRIIASTTDLASVNISASWIYGVTFTSAYTLQTARIGDTRLFSGGVVAGYDGAQVTEQGFLLAPDIITVTDPGGSSTPGGPAASPTVYQICAVYEWVDAQGNYHRSAPSVPVTYSVTTSGGLPTVVVSNLAATNKPNVTVALYATKANGSLFYRIASQPNTTAALGSYQSSYGTIFTSVAFPTGAVAAETLYTTGNVLANDPWPAALLVTHSRNRIFTVNSEDPEVLTFSKAYVKNEGLGTSLAFTKRVSGISGPITALAAMDDKVVIFKQRGILYFYGQNGPGVDGANDDFSPTQILTTEVGCIARNSILVTADGVYFQSEKGVWLLTRAMNLTFVGQPVAPLTLSKNITSAVLMPKQTTVRFGALASPSLVYHYRLQAQYGGSLVCGQWTTFSNYSQFNATLHNGVYHFARSDGKVCYEVDGFYKDDTSPVSFTLRTAWQKVGALMQWGQYTDLALLGAYEGPHTLAVQLFRDYRDASDTTLRYDSAVGIGTTAWGSGAWGSTSPFGGDSDNTYVGRWRLPGSVCAAGALSLQITDAAKSGVDFGASCQILGLTLIAQAQSDLVHTGDKKKQ